jgi:hypothetical protein
VTADLQQVEHQEHGRPARGRLRPLQEIPALQLLNPSVR